MDGDAPIERFKALAHPLRFRILSALAGGERNVGEIEDASGIGQPALSQQLAVLRQAGLVRTRREAKLVYYAPDGEVLAALAGAISGLVPAGGGEPDDIIAGNPVHGAAQFARLD